MKKLAMMKWLQDEQRETVKFRKHPQPQKQSQPRTCLFTLLYAKRVASCGEDDEEEAMKHTLAGT
jgi:hypothetical protein